LITLSKEREYFRFFTTEVKNNLSTIDLAIRYINQLSRKEFIFPELLYGDKQPNEKTRAISKLLKQSYNNLAGVIKIIKYKYDNIINNEYALIGNKLYIGQLKQMNFNNTTVDVNIKFGNDGISIAKFVKKYSNKFDNIPDDIINKFNLIYMDEKLQNYFKEREVQEYCLQLIKNNNINKKFQLPILQDVKTTPIINEFINNYNYFIANYSKLINNKKKFPEKDDLSCQMALDYISKSYYSTMELVDKITELNISINNYMVRLIYTTEPTIKYKDEAIVNEFQFFQCLMKCGKLNLVAKSAEIYHLIRNVSLYKYFKTINEMEVHDSEIFIFTDHYLRNQTVSLATKMNTINQLQLSNLIISQKMNNAEFYLLKNDIISNNFDELIHKVRHLYTIKPPYDKVANYSLDQELNMLSILQNFKYAKIMIIKLWIVHSFTIFCQVNLKHYQFHKLPLIIKKLVFTAFSRPEIAPFIQKVNCKLTKEDFTKFLDYIHNQKLDNQLIDYIQTIHEKNIKIQETKKLKQH
jgi:hypothetical protein